MKKVISILSLFVFTALLISGCKKDTPTATINSGDLSVSSWVNKGSTNGINIVETITFTSPTAFTDVAILTGSTSATLSVSGTYTYSLSTVKFTTTTGTTMTGTINGNNLYAPSANGNTVVTYVKQ